MSLRSVLVVSASSGSELGIVRSSISGFGVARCFFEGLEGNIFLEDPASNGSEMGILEKLLLRFLDIPLSCPLEGCSWFMSNPRINGLWHIQSTKSKDFVDTHLACFQSEITFSRIGLGLMCPSFEGFRQLGHSCFIDKELLMH